MYEAQLHDLFESKKLGYQFKTIEGETLEVLDFGRRNYDAGPDFQFAKVRHKGIEWVGHIEFHLKSSDWFRHHHQYDVNYENVIAHFVWSHDKPVKSGNYELPTVELKYSLEKLDQKMAQTELNCQNQLGAISENLFKAQQERALRQRIERKLDEAAEIFQKHPTLPQKAVAKIIAAYITPKVNQESFKSLVEEIPEQFFKKGLSLIEWEAILFSLSALLPAKADEAYILELNRIAKKFDLKPSLTQIDWKYSTMRPSSQPIFKMAQLAAILTALYNSNELILSSIQLQKVRLSDYWQTHLNFNKESRVASIKLGQGLIQRLVINAFIPIETLVNVKTKKAQFSYFASKLQELDPEKNKIITKMKSLGFLNETAADSQALIEQKNELCQRKKCLLCKIGQSLLKS